MATKKPTLHKEVQKARKRRDASILRRAARGDTHEQIADAIGMTRQRVGQIIRASKEAAGA